MRIQNIKGTKIDLTPAITDYVKKRLSALSKVISAEDTSARADIEVGKRTIHHKEGDLFFAEVNLHLAGRDFRAVSEQADLYTAIDEAKDEIIREVVNHKDRERTLIRRGGAIVKDLMRGVTDFGRGFSKRFSWKRFRRK